MSPQSKLFSGAAALPLVRELPSDCDPLRIFESLSSLPGRIWFDSANESGASSQLLAPRGVSDYSFLSADPIHRLAAYPTDTDPFPELTRLQSHLPTDRNESCPPFQGGLAGVIGYEANRWLEPDELAPSGTGPFAPSGTANEDQVDDLPTPALSIGVYDWSVAIDHRNHRTWLICQGFDRDSFRSGKISALPRSRRLQLAQMRADQIESLIMNLTEDGQGSDRHFGQTNIRVQSNSVRVTSNFSSSEFQSAVAEIVSRIRAGDSFQVNLAQRLTAEITVDAPALYRSLRESNPAPFAGFYDGGEFQVLSSSPEGFLQLRQGIVETRPIKGTVPRTGDKERDDSLAKQLAESEKDIAENIMIVDLMRNDLSRVCSDDSVQVTQTCAVERYQCVQHLVSVVRGRLRDDRSALDLLHACFPGGSVTGAPKIEAMKTIRRLEPNPRGPYCGSMGYISCSGDADFNILIRTITASGDRWQIPVGGGITARSIPEAEEAETWAKARGMLNALPSDNARKSTEKGLQNSDRLNQKISSAV